MNIDVSRLIEASISSVIGGLFTVLGVFITIGYYKKKDAEDLANRVFDKRPNLVLVENTSIQPDLHLILLPYKTVDIKGDFIDVSYDRSYLRINSLEYYDYTFRNIGKSEITYIHFIMNLKKWGSITEIDSNFYPNFIKDGYISHSVSLDKRVHTGECFKVRFYHLKKKAIGASFSAILSVSLHDDHDLVWGQLFFYPESKFYSSVKYSQIGSYHEDIRPRDLVKYFTN